jgi:group I intron endonuclease
MKISGIYEIYNTTNGKNYIGSSVNIKRRWSAHKRNLNRKEHKNDYLQNSWNKHGEENFNFIVLEEVKRVLLRNKEYRYIRYLVPDFNIAPVRGKFRNHKLSEKHKNKLSKAQTGKTLSEEQKEKIGLSGENNPYSKLTEEEVSKIKGYLLSTNLTQKQISEKFNVKRRTISDIKTGRYWGEVKANENNFLQKELF